MIINKIYSMELIQNVPIEYVSKLFENNMKIRKKTIYDFHLKIVHDHLTELCATRQTTCKSGFIREIIYKVLDSLSFKFKLEIVGHKLKRSLCRWISGPRRFYTPGMMIRYINTGMVIEEEFCQSQIDAELDYNTKSWNGSSKYTDSYADLSSIKSLFDKNVSYETKWKIIERVIDDKWNIFENCNLYKPIKQITLV